MTPWRHGAHFVADSAKHELMMTNRLPSTVVSIGRRTGLFVFVLLAGSADVSALIATVWDLTR
jgi:hypothetical protein